MVSRMAAIRALYASSGSATAAMGPGASAAGATAAACDGCNDNAACESFGIECGKACTDDFSCADGMFCNDSGFCDAECTQGGDQCGEEEFCSNAGRCQEGSGAGNTGGGTSSFSQGGNGASSGEGGSCPSVQIVFEPVSQPWGLREFAVRDLDGHVLRFCAEG